MESFDHNRPLVYLASPLFSVAELTFNLALAERIEASLDVYLPQRDGGKLVDLIAHGVEVRAAYKSIFDRDIRALEAATALVIVLDGRAVDEGAALAGLEGHAAHPGRRWERAPLGSALRAAQSSRPGGGRPPADRAALGRWDAHAVGTR